MKRKINLFGYIGSWWMGTDHASIAEQIEDLGAKDIVELHINSGGGSLFDGVGIYNSLKQFEGKVVVYVDALAASAASIIALAGDEIIMGEGSVMMIHNPWLITMSDADGHRKNADVLDLLRDAMIGIYKSASGKDEDELRQMLDDETYMTAEQAVEHGFATRVYGRADDNAVAALAQFGMDTSPKVPAWLRDKVVAAVRVTTAPQLTKPATPKGMIMDLEETSTETQAPVASTQAPAPEANVADIAAQARAAGAEAERIRQRDIRNACAAASIDAEFTDSLISEGVDFATASARIFAKMAESGPAAQPNITPASSGIEVGETSAEKFGLGVQNMILSRAGVEDFDPTNSFNGYSLMEICRMSLERRGVKTRNMSKMELVGRAFTMPQSAGGHTTDDFTVILGNSANKAVLRAYEEAEETFEEWTYRGSMSNFQIHSRMDLNTFPSLRKVAEGAEFKNVTIGERKEIIQLATYGDIFPISRQAIINDDLGLFNRLPQKMGRAAKRTVGDLVYAVLTGNPKMDDGVALFHANHSNLGNKALTVDNLDAAITAMRLQKLDKASLGIRAAYAIVPVTLESEAESLVTSEFKPGTQEQKNPIRDKVKVIGEHRLDDDSVKNWYLAASASQYDTIEVGYLDGNSAPRIERNENWTTDGIGFKVAIDATAAPMNHRALRKEVAP